MSGFGLIPAHQIEDESDGRPTWLTEYKESPMANDARVSLQDNLQHKWFTDALNILFAKRHQLNRYDHDLIVKLNDGYAMVGRELTVTVKQMNHIKGIAAEIESGKYD